MYVLCVCGMISIVASGFMRLRLHCVYGRRWDELFIEFIIQFDWHWRCLNCVTPVALIEVIVLLIPRILRFFI